MLKKTLSLCLGTLLTVTVAEAAITTDVLGRDSRECVIYARSRVPSLPRNLWTWNDKKAIKNSSSCKKGSVAIIDVGNSIGHVAVVERCDSSGSSQGITITETGWKRGYLTKRTSKTKKISKSQSELKIYGYYRP
ncbi:MAG TPA: CHAP domain-containing protein [Candidatus Paceibacterota bacterium]|nr:CHAP domain-containing protein [Candidatus Paceibacterota bacterium]